ncbi:hypothetical protein Hanom_Chr06g00538371 [Helianthus anomalus]
MGFVASLCFDGFRCLSLRVVNEMHSTWTSRKKEWAEKLSNPEVFRMYSDETMYFKSNPDVFWF